MTAYRAPLVEMRFVMDELAGFRELATEVPAYAEATPDLADAILEEAARFAEDVLAPLNRVGDREGARLSAGAVTTAPGWREAYAAFCAAGWHGIASPGEFGGQGLPGSLAVAVKEMVCSANLSFSLAPLLTTGAVDALLLCADDALKAAYLEKMVSGEWTGTMNLTEPQAGSDLGLIRSRAEPAGDGSYRVFGQKIFITYGDHDLTANIVHLVLARLPDAPPGVKGISLFLVPKVLPDGQPNDVRCVSLEHKLGIHGSPTCVMAYGDAGGAVGHLLGEPHRGLEYMFVMMNEARLGVGLQGVALGERAYQAARAYARERRQGRDALTGEALVSLDRHPDVRRMLMLMKSRVEACRALTYLAYGLMDRSRGHPDPGERRAALALAEFLIPLVKAGSTEMAVDVASLAIQVHGGMGYIEETGVAQLLRDARITTIYEGTTGIQANDLVFRKLFRDSGATARELSARVAAAARELAAVGDPELAAIGARLAVAGDAWTAAGEGLLARAGSDPAGVLAGAVPYLNLAVIVAGGWQLGRAALAAVDRRAAGAGDGPWLAAKIASARFYAEHVLPQASAWAETVAAGAAGLAAGLPDTD
ncbi:MAG: acyl-CoA dehydrogenase [Betaproteobacteria bacterium]|jgi:acyl-CoA dehydrogenase|nr:acyl-CoA dehydrogenase [Betaproteobacteria bacterium]HNM80125.1 acyl-CoA dehydrogenase [Rhodocyclaceae bacterium]